MKKEILLLLSLSQNQFDLQINKNLGTIFIIGNSIGHSKFENQRRDFKFWDRLIKKFSIFLKANIRDLLRSEEKKLH